MPRSSRRSESAEGVCPVCSENINIYAVGMCDHPVCYICLTRMRVLCDQMQCAICRLELPKVIFLKNSAKYADTDTSNFPIFRKQNISFENESVQDAFYELLDHACPICSEKKKFQKFSMLRDHMRREHQLNYCDLCVNHLRVFTHERKYYDRTRLGLHRRVGDADDKSHKGHPLCEFCDERFLDNDELVRHLRKEHYFCHFCDADGITNQFYSEYSFLREHFKEAHYLCEEGECQYVEFTSAFRSEIDLKAHFATEHANRMKKSHARQARTLDIGFNLVPRPGGRREWDRDRDRHRDRDRDRDRHQNRDRDQGRPSRGRQNGGSVITGNDYEEVNQDNRGGYGRNRGRGGGRGYSHDHRQKDREAKEAEDTARAVKESMKDMPVPRDKDFPSLDGKVVEEKEPEQEPVKPDPSQPTTENMAMYVARNNNFSISDGRMAEEDFPSLGGSNKKTRPGKDGNSAWAFKPNKSDFPVLGNPKKPQANAPKSKVSATWQNKATAAPAPAPHQITAPVKRPQSVPNVSREPPSLSSIGSVLLSSSKSSNKTVSSKPVHTKTHSSNFYNADDVEDFPTLGNPVKTQQSTGAQYNSKPSSKKGSTQSYPIKKTKTVEAMFDEEFPSLGGSKPLQPQITTALPASTTPKDPESIAMKKLQNQQKKLERDWFELPEEEPEPEPKKAEPQKTNKKEQEKTKKTQEKSSQGKTKEKVKSEEKSSKTIDSKSSQQKKHVEEKSKKADFEPPKDKLQISQNEKPQEKKGAKEPEMLDDDFPSLGGSKSTGESSESQQWQTSQSEKSSDKKKKKKAEKFEEDFPSLGGKPTESAVYANWGQKEKNDSKEPEDEAFKVKSKKKNKKEKNDANKQKAESEPEPTWGYIPDFVAPVVPKEKPKQPPGIVYKENKENKRDKNQPWGNLDANVDADFPTLFKVSTDELSVSTAGALKDQSNISLANITANMKGFSITPTNPIPEKPETINIDDFPSLGGTSLPKPPPGLGFVPSVAIDDPYIPPGSSGTLNPKQTKPVAKPPPGFSVPNVSSDATVAAPPAPAKPPPGFGAPATSVPPSSPMEPPVVDNTMNDTAIDYQKPNNFMERNRNLICAVQEHLGDSEEKFMQFKKSSGQFRQGKMSGSEYYAQCNDIIGPDGFREIFSELLALLPDIDKQHELLVAHNAARQPQRGMSTKKEKAQRKAWSSMDTFFSTCPTCRQVLVDKDIASHGTEHHMDMDFPTLGSVPGFK